VSDDILDEMCLFGTFRRENHSFHIVCVGLVAVVVSLNIVVIRAACG